MPPDLRRSAMLLPELLAFVRWFLARRLIRGSAPAPGHPTSRCLIIQDFSFVLFYVAIMTSVALAEKTPASRAVPEFAFLTNHGKALLLIAHDRRIRIRDIAGLLNITERATQRIVADLAKAGYIEREREGRRTLYGVSDHLPLGLPIQRDVDIGALLAILPAPSGAP